MPASRSNRLFWVGYALLLTGMAAFGIELVVAVGDSRFSFGEIVVLVAAAVVMGAGARTLHSWKRQVRAERVPVKNGRARRPDRSTI
ncbi:hypothetical protein [Actinomadura hibisca]|uniref:hypothetical protein n=1 Tax=Actinomadura hibisca TaxID=68565 RepID=UPI00082AD747|nr:hypothetical protein [Actinomadura hibisca]